ncbi:polysaccharide transporter, PST family [Marivirga sericea]|uniref:Polysaccharide transporter, PST family n=1 Tax=Marivirga sericea TaxID=1028 RepID=A0A1X7I4W0_9BACT|nr:hypothetical protein [Marivirga sericea]SMG08769.1 polysaccharide transporter, PST family [Marivirga sericea]
MLKIWTRYHHSIWSGILLAIRVLVGFGAQKIVAVFYGPVGTTLFSHFQNFIALFTQPIQDAAGNGLINAFPKKSLARAQVVGATIIILVFLTFSSGLILLISTQFNQSFYSFSLHNWLLIIPSLLLFCFGLIVSAIYVIQQKLKLYSFIILGQWSIFFISVLFVDLQLNHFLIYWLTLQAVFSLFLILPVRSYLKIDLKIDNKVKSHFKQFLLMALTVWISSKWVDYYVREFAIEQYGTIQTGLWQSVVRISEAYRGLVISFLFLTLYPLVAQKLGEAKTVVESFKKFYGIYVVVSILSLIMIFQFNDLILRILYDTQYAEAGGLLQAQVIGDLFAFLAFPFTIFLIASVKTKAYIITELVSALIFVTLITAQFELGIEVLVYAHIVRFFFYAIMVSVIGLKSLSDVR